MHQGKEMEQKVLREEKGVQDLVKEEEEPMSEQEVEMVPLRYVSLGSKHWRNYLRKMHLWWPLLSPPMWVCRLC